MAKTYMSQVPAWSTCEVEYCGGVYKYFCVRCNHYVVDCRHFPGTCACEPDRQYWAAAGERPTLRAQLENDAGLLTDRDIRNALVTYHRQHASGG